MPTTMPRILIVDDEREITEILADLLRSNESIMLNLEELRKRVDKGA